MLIQSALTSTLFRLGVMALILVGFVLTSKHFFELNGNNNHVFAFIIEALLAYFLSGFYLLFKDERETMRDLLCSLPIRRFYWFKNDLLAMVAISLAIHVLYFPWQLDMFDFQTIPLAWVYHLFLLIVCYPLRTLPKDKTFTTFVVLLILTIITVYKIS